MSDRSKPATSKPSKLAKSKGSSGKAASESSSRHTLEVPPFHVSKAKGSTGTPPSDVLSRLSNSNRCDLSDITKKPGGTVMESLMDRSIFIMPHMTIDAQEYDEEDAEEADKKRLILQSIKDMGIIYDEATKPRWISFWKRKEDLPNFGPHSDEYHEELLNEFRLTSADVLEPAAANSLIQRLASIFECCDLARTRNSLAVKRGANEMERRQAWDEFLAKAALPIDSKALHSIDVLCERGLNFPINPYHLLLRTRGMTLDDIQKYRDRLTLVQSIYFAAERSLKGSRSPRTAQCQIMADYIGVYIRRVEALISSMDEDSAVAVFEKIIRQRCARESLGGICDSALVVPCENAGFRIHEALFTQLHSQASKSSPNNPPNVQDIFNISVTMMEDFHLILSPTPDKTTDRRIPFRPDPTLDGRIPLGSESSDPSDQPHDEEAEEKSDPLGRSTQWPDVPIPHGLQTRCIRGLNSFATDCSTADGLPRPLFTSGPSPTPAVDALPKSYTALGAKFRELLANHKANSKSLHLDDDLLLVLLFVEFKKARDSTIRKATNQARNYASAALKFLELLGITNESVYLLVTNGNRGALSLARFNEPEIVGKTSTRSDEPKRQSIIMEWNVRTYDLASASDVYELTVFMQSLAERGKTLKAMFVDKYLKGFIDRVKADPEILKWSMCSWIPKEERRMHRNKVAEELRDAHDTRQGSS